jgi:hypothetical protein
MSAAAARRRKQLAGRKEPDTVGGQLNKLLECKDAPDASMSEETAYEALQLAQSLVRKNVVAGELKTACDLSYTSALTILQKGRVSVASQLLTLLVEVLSETQTKDTPEWLERLAALQEAHAAAMEKIQTMNLMTGPEASRLNRLQREWLRQCVQWSSDIGNIKYGANKLHELLGQQCWKLSLMPLQATSNTDEEDAMDFSSDAVIHMSLAEKPDTIVEWLKTLPAPTEQETKLGHTRAPALRDALLTRSLLCMCAVENLRDANTLLRAFLEKVEDRDSTELKKSYTNKDDGKAPSHAIFGCMLVSICEKDTRTGPLFSWLLRSFKKELDLLHKPEVILSYTTKIGKIYYNMQPPPSMLNMMENMMSMMGGGGGGGGGGGPAGMNPAMMQAAMAQMGGMM